MTANIQHFSYFAILDEKETPLKASRHANNTSQDDWLKPSRKRRLLHVLIECYFQLPLSR